MPSHQTAVRRMISPYAYLSAYSHPNVLTIATVMRGPFLRLSKDALAGIAGWSAMFMEAVVIGSCKREPATTVLAPEIIVVGIDLADIVADAGMEVRTTVGVLELKDVLGEVAILAANFERNTVIGERCVLLCMGAAVGCKMLEFVVASWLASVRLVAAEEDHWEGARVTDVCLTDTGSLDGVNSCIGALFCRQLVI